MATWMYEVLAHNTATDSDNRIHADDVAQQYGFRGGLVPGVDVWAYLVHPCIDRWGDDFFTHGVLDARFGAPVYEDELVTVDLADDGSIRCIGPDGSTRATGQASVVADHPDPVDVPYRKAVADRPPASEESLATGTVLGTLEFTFRADRAAVYLADIRETDARYDNGGRCHPAFHARQCNYVLAGHVVLGPWIHVGTVARHRGEVRDGDAVEVRGRVVAEREHKGHRFVDLDVVIRANGTVVFDAFHTAIWQPRTTR